MLNDEAEPGFNTIYRRAAAWPSRCDSCRAVPWSVYCRADAAYLCGSCDTSVHSATTPGRHSRVPVLPVQAGGLVVAGIAAAAPRELVRRSEEQEEEEYGFVDEYLDLVEFGSCEEEGGREEKEKKKGWEKFGGDVDGVVPVVGEEDRRCVRSFPAGFEGFDGGGDRDYGSTASSLDHNISLSSIETTGVRGSLMIDITSSHSMTSKGTIDLFSAPLQMPHMFSPMDREAKVLRYREKKKSRKFQKIIRYASRKAYAETRPRIKGRFAKRKDVEHEVDQMFAAPVMIETSYGVVPSY